MTCKTLNPVTCDHTNHSPKFQTSGKNCYVDVVAKYDNSSLPTITERAVTQVIVHLKSTCFKVY